MYAADTNAYLRTSSIYLTLMSSICIPATDAHPYVLGGGTLVIEWSAPVIATGKRSLRCLEVDEYVRPAPQLLIQPYDGEDKYCTYRECIKLRNAACHKLNEVNKLLENASRYIDDLRMDKNKHHIVPSNVRCISHLKSYPLPTRPQKYICIGDEATIKCQSLEMIRSSLNFHASYYVNILNMQHNIPINVYNFYMNELSSDDRPKIDRGVAVWTTIKGDFRFSIALSSITNNIYVTRDNNYYHPTCIVYTNNRLQFSAHTSDYRCPIINDDIVRTHVQLNTAI